MVCLVERAGGDQSLQAVDLVGYGRRFERVGHDGDGSGGEHGDEPLPIVLVPSRASAGPCDVGDADGVLDIGEVDQAAL